MFRSITLRAKLLLGFAVVACITIIVGGVGYWANVRVSSDLRVVSEESTPAVDSLLRADASITRLLVAARTMLIPDLDDAQYEEARSNFDAARVEYRKAFETYEALPREADEAALWKEWQNRVAAWAKANNHFISTMDGLHERQLRDPTRFLEHIQQWRGDHYKLVVELDQAIRDMKPLGYGADETACNFGKWVGGYETNNDVINRILNDTHVPHNAFHAAVAKIDKFIELGDQENAILGLENDMKPAMEGVFTEFAYLAREIKSAQDMRDEMAQWLLVESKEVEQNALAKLFEVIELNRVHAQEVSEDAIELATFSQWMVILGIVIGGFVAIALGWLLSAQINAGLRKVIHGLRSGSEQVNSASDQVSGASQSLAQGASEQASSLEQVSASLEQMAAMTKQNAENAGQANAMAKDAGHSVNEGREAMERMSAAINKIKSSADETAKIIKTIDEIAFQTNLLALNAAVEAARAGEAGKGFAVVAEEVRSLAQRSAEAAKSTARLIEESQDNADSGVKVGDEVAKLLGRIVGSVSNVTGLINEVSNASNEQAQGIDQVNSAVAQMDQVTQSNAANAEQSASASEELSAQAGELSEMVNSLNRMVGGAGAKSIVTAALTHQPVHKKLPQAPQLVPTSSSREMPLLSKTKENSKIKAEQVIPFDDGDFNDF